jgi:hypothetical protein
MDNKLIVVIMGPGKKHFAEMCLESVKNADKILYWTSDKEMNTNNLFPIVNDAVNDVNVTGVTGGSLIKLIPFFYILLIIGGAIGGGIAGFKG